MGWTTRLCRWSWTCLGWLILAGMVRAAAPIADPPSLPEVTVTAGTEVPPAPGIGALRRPLQSLTEPAPAPLPVPEGLLQTPVDPPTGYAGPSGVLPSETQQNSHFVPVEDRWRIGYPDWDRYGKGHPLTDDYPFDIGNIWNPYKQNVLKGDYPIIGQHTFLILSASTFAVLDAREVPTPATSFESTANPGQMNLFGIPGQFFYTQYFTTSVELFQGDAAFKPVDWRVKVTPVFNVNSLNINELGVVEPDVQEGANRGRTYFTLQEWFVEKKLADLGPDYDFISIRAGSQPFNADFRGFLFADTNRAVRLFGTLNGNREQFNLVYFDQMEKDTNSELNELFHSRDQRIVIGNFFVQDFIFPGYTALVSGTYNHDSPTFHFNKNDALVRPDADGIFQPHGLDIFYLGWGGNGHIDRFNIMHQFYWALGRDSDNPIANQPEDVNAQFFATELSYDRDYVRFRTSFMYASGDKDPNNSHATGFDSIMDNPQFAGGEFSYWQRQAIGLFNVNLVQARSFLPDLRSSKIEGQSNFVNPGLLLGNFGVDIDITPKLKMLNNLNFMWFDQTAVLEQFVFQSHIDKFIGVDASVAFQYRPLLSNNIIVTTGLATFFPGEGFQDIYNNLNSTVNPMVAGFLELNLNF